MRRCLFGRGVEIWEPIGLVIMIFLHPNFTSIHQRMDQGIIQAVKTAKFNPSKYRNLRTDFSGIKKMLAGTAGLNEGWDTYLDDMGILNVVWNEMEVSTIARCWAKSATLTPSMNADILAEHASRTKRAISQETKDLFNNIVDNFSKLSLLRNSQS